MSWNNFKAPNLGLLVYKRLYLEHNVRSKVKYDKDELKIDIPKNDQSPFDQLYDAIYNNTLNDDFIQIVNPATSNKFVLFTTYPGLLCGTGYTHDSNAKGDIKIGFYFDHTTGQPVIPGSSVKGVLKSVFENENDKTDETSVAAVKFFIEEIIKESNEPEKKEWQLLHSTYVSDETNCVKSITGLKESVFGTPAGEGIDIFYDAVIDIESTGKNKKFLANDFITPHIQPDKSYEDSMLKDPTPLMFLKVLPNIAFEFRFKLRDSIFEVTGTDKEKKVLTFCAAKKQTLFKKILCTLGVGAKTNVGYGQFTGELPAEYLQNQQKKISGRDVNIRKYTKDDIPRELPSLSDLKKHDKKTDSPGTILFAEVTDITPSLKKLTVNIKVKEKSITFVFEGINTELFSRKDILQVEYRGKTATNHQFKLAK
jgi:CRISPR-associated protein Cmr6